MTFQHPENQKQVLIDTKALLADGSKRIKGRLAKRGCYCLLGGIARASGVPDDAMDWSDNLHLDTEKVYAFLRDSRAVQALSQVSGFAHEDDVTTNVICLGDTRSMTHDEVMAKLDEAIAICE